MVSGVTLKDIDNEKHRIERQLDALKDVKHLKDMMSWVDVMDCIGVHCTAQQKYTYAGYSKDILVPVKGYYWIYRDLYRNVKYGMWIKTAKDNNVFIYFRSCVYQYVLNKVFLECGV